MSAETKETSEKLWEGIVSIDESFDDYANSVNDYQDYKSIIIRDISYPHRGVGNITTNLGRFPETTAGVAIKIIGKTIMPIMKCVFSKQTQFRSHEKGIFRKRIEYYPTSFNYELKLTPTDESGENFPRLASFRSKIGKDDYIHIHQHGDFCLFSGSRSAETTDAARRSLTMIFCASKNMPFLATVREKGNAFNVKVDGSGFLEKPANYGKIKKEKTSTKDPLEILKVRLAKGEITKEEYDDLKNVLEP